LWSAAFTAAAVGWAIKLVLPDTHPIVRAAVILIPFGGVYFVVTLGLGVTEARGVMERMKRAGGDNGRRIGE
jgi:hypothetical protein